MQRIIYSTITLFIFSTMLQAQEPVMIDPLAPGENIYKHYAGTIGNRKAVVDLRYGFQGAINYGGSTCYFTDGGGLYFFLISKPPTALHTDVFRAQVFPEHLPLSEIKEAYSIFVQTERLEFRISHDSLIGKWYGYGGQEAVDLILKEDNRNSLPFVFSHGEDSVTAKGKKNELLKATASYRGVEPAPAMKANDAAFINKEVARFMGGPAGAGEPKGFAQSCFRRFLGGFKAAVNDGKALDGSNFSGVYTLFPVYNENGILVLQKGGYQYDFETKEYTDQNLYMSLDVKNKQALTADNILMADKGALAALLESAFRKKYRIDGGKKLAELMIAGKMPVTDNIIVTGNGLLFSYWPVKVFHESEAISELQEIRLFLSYSELAGLLKPEFRARMGIK